MNGTSLILSAFLAGEDQAGQMPDGMQPFLPDLLCAACAAALPITGVGLGLMSDHGPEGLVAVTDGSARVMEEL